MVMTLGFTECDRMEDIMKKERRADVRWPEPYPWTHTASSERVAPGIKNHKRMKASSFNDWLAEILTLSWAWRVLYK
jgi:hypothetical protein